MLLFAATAAAAAAPATAAAVIITELFGDLAAGQSVEICVYTAG